LLNSLTMLDFFQLRWLMKGKMKARKAKSRRLTSKLEPNQI
jgi:hypothetical protein